jgi:hypothetical protein
MPRWRALAKTLYVLTVLLRKSSAPGAQHHLGHINLQLRGNRGAPSYDGILT